MAKLMPSHWCVETAQPHGQAQVAGPQKTPYDMHKQGGSNVWYMPPQQQQQQQQKQPHILTYYLPRPTMTHYEQHHQQH